MEKVIRLKITDGIEDNFILDETELGFDENGEIARLYYSEKSYKEGSCVGRYKAYVTNSCTQIIHTMFGRVYGIEMEKIETIEKFINVYNKFKEQL